MASTLAHHLLELEAFLRRDGDAPEWAGVLIVEDAEMLHGARRTIRRSSLRTPHEYSSRFDELVAYGFGWINHVGNGVLDRQLIVSLETPRQSSGVPTSQVAVNVSGPYFDRAGKKAWDLSSRFDLI